MPPVRMSGDGRKARNPGKTLGRLLSYMKRYIPALIGVLCSVICLVIFGEGSFLIPAMVLITAALALYGKRKGGTGND